MPTPEHPPHTHEGLAASRDNEWLPFDDLRTLDDETYLRVSHDFGLEYSQLLGQNEVADLSRNKLAEPFRAALETYMRPLEGLSDAEAATVMISGYRQAYNELLQGYGKEPAFTVTEPTRDALDHVIAVKRAAYGVPILYSDDNELLFGHGGTSFCSSRLLMQSGLPPLVVVGNGVGDKEKQAASVHEASHAAWAIMEAAAMIPHSDDGEEALGKRSAFGLARDEAAAMQVAGQGKIIHPNVIAYLKADGFDEQFVERYRSTCYRYADALIGVQGLEQGDAVFGFMQARNWDEFFIHVERLTAIAESLKHAASSARHKPITSADGWSVG